MLGVVRSYSYYQHTAGNLINSLIKNNKKIILLLSIMCIVLCFPQHLIVLGFVPPIYLCMLEAIRRLMYRL